ncbi:MAG: hypothetical protein EDM03_01610 [Porphyrobacter sp. IPPAS B-1204]|nr:MAG: hypothetical protein EDM03_01610 [Porphyrobacter sp. IPPAS B-1204]
MTRTLPLAAIAAIAAIIALPAHAQVMPEPDVTEVAKTPLRDLNIDARDIPEVLQTAVRDPYATQGMETCNALVTAIANLDMALGADYDIAESDGNDRLSEGRIGQSIVGSFLPFRGIVREVSGAAGNERQLRAAYTAGMVRRAFLKGWGLGRGCAYPARPKVLAATGE